MSVIPNVTMLACCCDLAHQRLPEVPTDWIHVRTGSAIPWSWSWSWPGTSEQWHMQLWHLKLRHLELHQPMEHFARLDILFGILSKPENGPSGPQSGWKGVGDKGQRVAVGSLAPSPSPSRDTYLPVPLRRQGAKIASVANTGRYRD